MYHKPTLASLAMRRRNCLTINLAVYDDSTTAVKAFMSLVVNL